MRATLTALILGPSIAFANCTDDAMLVFDASSSMSAVTASPDVPTRIVEARAALRDALPSVAPYRRIGLMVYGPGETTGCSHISLHFAPMENAADQIIADIEAVAPDGSTALTWAVQAAVELLMQDADKGTIVLVTDGEETCGARTCEIAMGIGAQSPDMTVHVIGFRMRATYLSRDYSNFSSQNGGDPVGAECLAAHTGGLYVTATTIDELVAALRETLGCALHS